VPCDAKVINIMIAGPSNVGGVLQNVHDIIHNWNVMHAQEHRVVLLPLSWKSHASPEMGDRPQAIINRQVLVLCDLLVAVFWTRIGSPFAQTRAEARCAPEVVGLRVAECATQH
jgi:hypothetical protein